MPDGSANLPTGKAPEDPNTRSLQSGNATLERSSQQPASFGVASIEEGAKDLQGREITRVYALRPGKYAVYLARDVRIQYADDPDEEAAQRASVVSSVGKARAEITSLLVGWGPDQRRVYDCKVAMSLELGLEKKTEEARSMIEEAKTELIQERAAAGRLQYIGFAALWCMPLLALLGGVSPAVVETPS